MKIVTLSTQYNASREIKAVVDYAGQIETCKTANGIPDTMPAVDNDLVVCSLTVADAVATAMLSDATIIVLAVEDVIDVS